MKKKDETRITMKTQLKPKSDNQENFIRTMAENDLTICVGPAGCGKGHCAVGYGLSKLLAGEFKKLVITRPTVESGQGLGYLPGNIDEKFNHYMIPLLDLIEKYVGRANMQEMINNGKNHRGENEIRIIPLEFMRGISCDDSFMILDEAQNCLESEITMFVTRIGMGSKAVLIGDLFQSDLDSRDQGGLRFYHKYMDVVQDVGICELDNSDIVRSSIVQKVLGRVYEVKKGMGKH